MKNKKEIIEIILIILIIIFIGIATKFLIIKKKKSYYVNKQEAVLATDDIISKQSTIDEEIKKDQDNSSYTFKSPKIIQNPYLISPLTALIIFQTSKETTIDVYINDNKFTEVSASKKHSIPIYGLVAGIANKIKLVDKDGKTKEYDITTDDDPYALTVQANNGVKYSDFYFVSGPMRLGYGAFNSDGKLVWYLTSTGVQDLEFLSNGHILVSNDETYGSTFGFTGFYEVDYLGKIYKKYILENSYHHEVNELSDGNLMVAGMPDASKIQDAFVSTIDSNTGETLKSLDLYDVFNKVDPTFTEKLVGKDAVNHSIYYNEDTDEIILSLRGFSTVISLQYSTGEINWMLASQSDWSSNFSKYILKSGDGTRLPKGQHTAFISSEGYLGVFDNDYDPSNGNGSLNYFKDNYSSATYYKIDKSTMTYKTVWNYSGPDHEWDYALGSFNVSYDNHRIVNFG